MRNSIMDRWIQLFVLVACIVTAQKRDSLEDYFKSLRIAFDGSYPSLKQYIQASANGTVVAPRSPVMKPRPGTKRFGPNQQQQQQALVPRGYPSINQQQNIHDKRCFITDNSQAVEYYLQNSNRMNEGLTHASTILIATPCIGSDSLGNNLGAYFENIACANMVGLHYFSTAHIWEPSSLDAPTPFLAMIPDQIVHDNPVSDVKLAKVKIKTTCKCPGSCHERPTALWTRSLDYIKPILWRAVNNHVLHIISNETIVRSNDLSNAAVDTVLPLVPDAAIHYRCGDNFIGHYGMLPFAAFTKTIPTSVKTMYVLAENRDRKTKNRRHLAAKCDAIFDSLLQFLVKGFPQSTVLIRRGDDLYTDFTRLAMAKYVVCSVSTFCLWPAVMNQHGKDHVFFPKTRLIVQGNTEVDLGFSWLEQPAVVLGQRFEGANPQSFVKLLTGEQTGG